MERLPGSGSAVWPVLGYLTAAVFGLIGLLDGPDRLDLGLLAGCALLAGIVFVVLQRPAVLADSETLHLRGMVSTVHVPLAAVERIAVGRFLAVFAGDRRYVSPAVQRTLRAVIARPGGRSGADDGPAGRGGRGAGAGDAGTRQERVDVADLVEQRLGQLTEDARHRAGVRPLSDEQLALASGVRRTWSAGALAVVAGPAAALLVALLLLA